MAHLIVTTFSGPTFLRIVSWGVTLAVGELTQTMFTCPLLTVSIPMMIMMIRV